MTRTMLVGLCVAMALAVTTTTTAQAKKSKSDAKMEAKTAAKALCPITGEEIDKKFFADTAAGRVYVCCKGCIKKYTANTEKYAAKVFAQQDALGVERVQVTCPLSGEPVDGKTSLKHKGMTIKLCCEKCVAGFKKDPEKHMPGYYASFTTQTECPVMGEEIDPKSFATVADDQKVYFCCKRCVKKFESDRAKYAKRLSVFYMCTMRMCKDAGSLTGGDCAKCGMHRKQIGRLAKADAGDHDHEEHGEGDGHNHGG